MASFIERKQMSDFLTSGSLAFAKTRAILEFYYRIGQSSQRGMEEVLKFLKNYKQN
jgi:archaellum component FlaD/FlaE